MPTDMYEKRDRICNVIDRGEWKNSWHLPRSRYGDTDWYSPDTADKVRVLIEEQMNFAIVLLKEAHSLLNEINWDGYTKLREERERAILGGDYV